MSATKLFSSSGIKILREFVAPPYPLLALDYDGTLSPIISEPSKASATAEIRQIITRLRRFTTVIVLTGRSSSEISNLLGCEVDLIVGNHGLESDTLLVHDRKNMTGIVTQWLHQLGIDRSTDDVWSPISPLLVATYPELSGVAIEQKDLSVSIHYRKTIDPMQAKSILVSILNTLQPLPHIISGKKVLNLLPSNCIDKGTALLSLLRTQNYDRAVFLGDDETDELVFRKQSLSILGIKIGNGENTEAQLYIRTQSETVKALSYLLALFASHRSSEEYVGKDGLDG